MWSGHFDEDDIGINCVGFVGSVILPSHLDSCVFAIFTSKTTIQRTPDFNVLSLFVVVSHNKLNQPQLKDSFRLTNHYWSSLHAL